MEKGRPVKNISGIRFGRLVAVYPTHKRSGVCVVWLCHCDCGKASFVSISNLQSGNTTSCGCFFLETKTTHGQTRSLTWISWMGMKQRCYYKKHVLYKRYGGRGIRVCKRWKNSFKNFLKDMGKRPSKLYSIDRKDNDGNYEPDNCRWATPKQQANNRD